jgi:hypothetical protein
LSSNHFYGSNSPASSGHQATTVIYGNFGVNFKLDLNFMVAEPDPLEYILRDIGLALNGKLFYLALHLSLSVPDICASLEADLDPKKPWRGVEDRYIEWCSKHLEPHFKWFIASDCWALRGGVVHQGKLFGHPKARYDRIMFTLPGPITIGELLSQNNGGTTQSVLSIDLGVFCDRMITAAKSWYSQMKDDPIVIQNLPNLVRLRPEGLAPHIVGLPVIA